MLKICFFGNSEFLTNTSWSVRKSNRPKTGKAGDTFAKSGGGDFPLHKLARDQTAFLVMDRRFVRPRIWSNGIRMPYGIIRVSLIVKRWILRFQWVWQTKMKKITGITLVVKQKKETQILPDQVRSPCIQLSRLQYFPKPIWPVPAHPRSTNPKALNYRIQEVN